jgi:lipoprotein signal peptidase
MTHTTPVTRPIHTTPNHRRRRLCFGIAALTAGADLTSKAAVTLITGDQRRGMLLPLQNPRFTLGVVGFSHLVMLELMIGGIVAVIVVGLRLIDTGRVNPWPVGLIVGGAAANTIDRTLNGAVHDFLIVGPIIVNLADLAVLAGLTWSALSLLDHRRRREVSYWKEGDSDAPSTRRIRGAILDHRPVDDLT